ncbi:MAG: peroxidase-related enzyme [Ferrimicrobium sp.]
MSDAQIPYWYAVDTPAQESPSDIADVMAEVEAKTGFLPRIFTALSYFPEEFRAFFAYHNALMTRESQLSKAEREMIVVATSATNRCTYCVIAHGAILRVRAKHGYLSDQLAVDFEKADITDRQRAILRFAHTVSLHADQITPVDFEPLYAAGLDDDTIWLVGSIAAFFALSNRIAGLAMIMPNREFYLMGRNNPVERE